LNSLALNDNGYGGEGSGHPAVDAVLQCFGVDTPQNLRLAADLLRLRRTQDGTLDFAGSRLTGSGFPVECAVSHAENGLRLTIEPGARCLGAAARRELVLQLVRDIDPAALAHLDERTLASLDHGGRSHYGAWIGLRLGTARPSAKLYLEVPEGLSLALPFQVPALARRNLAIRMLGHSQSGAEYYLRIPALHPQELSVVLQPAGLSGYAPRVLELIEALYGYPVVGRLPGPSVGVSYELGTSPPKVTLYFFARSLWGGDRSIRERFLALGGDLWKGRAAYSRATEPLMERNEWRTCHGLLGIVLQPDVPPRFVIGFCPSLP
jgi:hypothetical protein